MQASVGLELISSTWAHSIHNHKSSISSQPTLTDDDHNQSSSSSSSLSDLEDESEPPVEYSAAPVHAEGVPQSNTKLSAKKYRTPEFGDSLFELLRSQLKLPGWSNLSDQYKSSITISKVSGSLTNAVFFVSCTYNSSSQPAIQLPDQESPPTVLLRIYGPSSGTLISRKEELHLLHTLSAKYGIGPLLLGTSLAYTWVWNNITRWQHEATKVFVDIAKALEKLGIQPTSNPSLPATDGEDPLERFRATPFPLSSPQALAELVKIVDLPRLILEMKSYRAWIYNHERIHGKSPRIFSHNDTQCGNLLLRQDDDPLLREQPQDQIMVIDFEYASANPRGFDIANHFHEWCADYHHPTHSYSLTRHGNYPTYLERKRFYRAYLGIDCEYSKTNSAIEKEQSDPKANSYIKRFKDCEISDFNLDEPSDLATPKDTNRVPGTNAGQGVVAEKEDGEEDGRVMSLEQDVNLWSPASHAMWALWGLVQARDDLKVQLDRWLTAPTPSLSSNSMDEFEFDYFSYSAERIILFRRLLAELNVPLVL
ncbi:uncharacterized protein PGTG_10644 [Puccinia graminis f. sp. tritici CRL 75-36-700-3]|uniref:Choline kinase N-terminal domain-containing protein n=1 Tax=Puccinia graminis f. sp. tritici (strain CRL 75-36-700-3 / race SCCL) TaxID=418459 RepID=E3KIZ1_PUCGT|nr:uncharacterized protein PGTG_10644 [Puccinia graminis f. sp. tritici CRL 75-36-700-3]EFP84266.1 hypothetical protein PGTG_10644 [Puccinia graminis f. sp. tritici CRL 75-36-700-3]